MENNDNILIEIISDIKENNFEYIKNANDRLLSTSYYIKLKRDATFCFETKRLWKGDVLFLIDDSSGCNEYLKLQCSNKKLKDLKHVINNYFNEKKNNALNKIFTKHN